jgi:hypothetical protein
MNHAHRESAAQAASIVRGLGSPKLAIGAMLLAAELVFMVADSAHGAPFCLLRKPFSPPQGNCFQFYLADAAVSAPRTMAMTAGGSCAVTPYAARQGWLPDPTFPMALATSGAGDSAMAVVSPYFGDAYKCRTGAGGTSGGGTGMPLCGAVCKPVQIINQPESVDSTGRTTVEAATIYVMDCPSTGQVYIYSYVNRPGYRAIHPGNWSQPIGGQDFQTCDAAERAAAGEAKPGGPETAGSDDKAELAWNANSDAYTVIGSKGTLTGSVESWNFAGPATLNGKNLNTNVTCSGKRNETKKDAPAEGDMTCDIAWEKHSWHCSGRGTLGAVWSLGDYWFGIWPGGCKGTITDDGKTRSNEFGLVGLKSGLGRK